MAPHANRIVALALTGLLLHCSCAAGMPVAESGNAGQGLLQLPGAAAGALEGFKSGLEGPFSVPISASASTMPRPLAAQSPVNTTASPATSPADLATLHNLTSYWSAPVPPPNSADQPFSYIVDKWELWRDRLFGGLDTNMNIVKNPFVNITQVPEMVLRVDYQNGTYRQGGNQSTGGATLYPTPMQMYGARRALLSYQVAFPPEFDFVQGGKLPGLFSGTDEKSCSGGQQSTGDCFSVRMMWREQGQGEVYAYLPPVNGLCPATNSTAFAASALASNIGGSKSATGSQSDIICNSDYGTSIGRGKFSFHKGSYTNVTMYVALNSAPSAKDGIVQVWADGKSIVNMTSLILSNIDMSHASNVDVLLDNPLRIFFSTFFGGSTRDWAAKQDTSTYFKDLQVWTDASPDALSSAMNQLRSRESKSSGASTSWSRHGSAGLSLTALLVLVGVAL